MKIWNCLRNFENWKNPARIAALALIPAALLSLAVVFDRLTPREELQESMPPETTIVATTAAATDVMETTVETTAASMIPETTQPTVETSLPTEAEESVTEAETMPLTESTEAPPETEPETYPPETLPPMPEIQDADETVYATTAVNVRTGPDTAYEKIGMLYAGEAVHRTGVTGTDWSRIEWEGETCFVSSNYVSTEEPAPAFEGFPISYSDGTMNLTITKEWFGQSWCYAAHVQLSDYSRLSTRCANGAYDNGYETTSGAAARAGAVFAVNGDYSAPYLGYIVVRDGTIWNGAERNMWMPGVYSSYTGLLQSAWETGGTPGVAGANVQQLVDDGIVTDTFCFGPPVLQNGTITVGSGGGGAQRTFIGTNGNPGDLWIVVSDGRYNDGESAGLTAEECGLFLQSKGCSFGIPLDGGGSSTMVFNGEVLNAARYGERAVVDFLVITN